MAVEVQSIEHRNSVVQFANAMAILTGVLVLAAIGAIALAFSERLTDDFSKLALSSFGSFVLVGSTTSIFYQYFLRRFNENRDHEKLSTLFKREVSHLERLMLSAKPHPAASTSGAPEPLDFGLTAVKREMDYASLFADLGRDDEVLWLDTYAPAEMAWMNELKSALQRGASVRMLILNEKSRFAELRSKEIGTPEFRPDRFRNGLASFTKTMEDISGQAKAWPGTLQIGIYDDLLGCPIYLVEKCGHPVKAYSSFYLRPPTGLGFPHLLWTQTNDGMLHYLKAYFEYKWEHAKK